MERSWGEAGQETWGQSFFPHCFLFFCIFSINQMKLKAMTPRQYWLWSWLWRDDGRFLLLVVVCFTDRKKNIQEKKEKKARTLWPLWGRGVVENKRWCLEVVAKLTTVVSYTHWLLKRIQNLELLLIPLVEKYILHIHQHVSFFLHGDSPFAVSAFAVSDFVDTYPVHLHVRS